VLFIKGTRASCDPFPEDAAAQVDPVADLQLKDRSTLEHALQCRRGHSAKQHLFDRLRFAGPAAPESQPVLPSKRMRLLNERAVGGESRDLLALKHVGRFLSLNISEECVQGGEPMVRVGGEDFLSVSK